MLLNNEIFFASKGAAHRKLHHSDFLLGESQNL
jgi:hypothetical protein